ncbi:hypothetical protein SEUCBS140593_005022 [Sporothrix eucalyptigena]|uniref:Carboxylesterase type B domain-containing protein n=1 Tax=Sporothrix eucalyptigena TaxID=1812306 RepID=A0ABP0BSW9_9PEZI
MASLVLLVTALAAPASALFTGGGLTILSQNNLDGAANDGSAAVLVHQPTPFAAASTSCTLLGETPFHPENTSLSTLTSTLAYQQFQGLASPSQQYWISKAQPSADECRSITATGNITNTDCLTQLPILCTQSAPVSNTSTVATENGAAWRVTQSVNGTLMTGYRDLHVWKFRGVRYANPPARFTYSQKATHQPGDPDVLAVTAGADCVQPIGEVRSGSSEDCLFANVWTPHLPRSGNHSQTELKPVMLYLYGGGFTSGSGKNPNTDGTNLASRGDVVSISVNYRVGNAGFLAFDDGVHRGNYALSDMVAALEWVRDYAAYFGGDASRVTLFGESAGAQATHILLGSPKARGLFHRAIMQSDPQGYPHNGAFHWMQYDTVAESYRGRTTKVLQAAGCPLNGTNADHIACLGKLTGFELTNLTTNVNGATIDSVYLTEPWLVVNGTSVNPGLGANISVMTGVNRDESGVLIDDYPANDTTFAAYLATKVGTHFGLPKNASTALAADSKIAPAFGVLANTTDPAQIFNASMAIATDGEFTCFDLAKSYSAARHGVWKATYAYQFNRTYQTAGYTKPWCTPAKTASRPHGDPDLEYYKCHAGEQMVVFATEARDGLPDRDGHDVAFMQLVVDYWSTFARTGDPNPDPAYLKVRGYNETLAQTQATGPWTPVSAVNPTVRLLQWNGAQVPFGNAVRCAALGIPLDVLETYNKV